MSARNVAAAWIATTGRIGQTVQADPTAPSARSGRTARLSRDRTGRAGTRLPRLRAMTEAAPISDASEAMTEARVLSAGTTVARARRSAMIAARAGHRPQTGAPAGRQGRIVVPALNAVTTAARAGSSAKIAARAVNAVTSADPGARPGAIADLALELGTKGSARVPPISPGRRVRVARTATTPARAGPRAPAGTGQARVQRAAVPSPKVVHLARARRARGRRAMAGQRAPRRCASLPGVFAARD